MGNHGRIGGQFLIVGGFNGLFPVGEHLVEFLHQVVPLRGGEIVKGLVVVSIEGRGLLALERCERAVVPIPDVVGKLADGVVALAGAPFGLVGGEACDGDVCRNKPIFLIVGGVKLLKQDSAQGGGTFRGLGGSGEGVGENGEGENSKESQFYHGSDLREQDTGE